MPGAGFSSSPTLAYPRAVVFVDGSNFRPVLAKLEGETRPGRLALPVTAYWRNVMEAIVALLNSPPLIPQLLRAYWYVPATLQQEGKETVAADFDAARENEEEVHRVAGCLAFTPAGYRKVRATKAKSGPDVDGDAGEKALDVTLAIDMLRLAPIYDVAVLLALDADYMPAIRAVKDLGKRVAVAEFQRADGSLLARPPKALIDEADQLLQVPLESHWRSLKRQTTRT
jgi:uncharacterized LabA/DUF88 family protein